MARNMWDYSDIIMGNRSGAIMGQGIQNAAGAISRGITDYRQTKKEKEAETAAIDWLKVNGKELGINTEDDGEIKAAVKAAGGGPQAMQMISGMQRMKQEKQMHALKVGEILKQQKKDELNSTALASAMQPVEGQRRQRTPEEGLYLMRDQTTGTKREPTGDEAVAAFLKAGGDPRQAVQIGQAYAQMEKIKAAGKPVEPFSPQLFDLGKGVTAMSTSAKSVVPISKGDAAGKKKDVWHETTIGGTEYIVGPGNRYFDKKTGKPVDFRDDDKPLTVNEWIMSGQPPEQYKTYREAFAKAKGGSETPAPGKEPEKKPGKPAAPSEISTKEEFDKLPKGARFIFNGRAGIKR